MENKKKRRRLTPELMFAVTDLMAENKKVFSTKKALAMWVSASLDVDLTADQVEAALSARKMDIENWVERKAPKLKSIAWKDQIDCSLSDLHDEVAKLSIKVNTLEQRLADTLAILDIQFKDETDYSEVEQPVEEPSSLYI